MPWEYLALVVITSLAYVVALLALSEEYASFIKSKGLRKGGAWIALIFAIYVLASSSIIIAWFLYVGGNIWALCAFLIVMLLPIFSRTRSVRKLRVVGSRKVVLDGEEVEYHVYSGPLVSAFYNHRNRRIYIHEKLEELLSEEELKAILYHEYRHSVQASKRPYSTALYFTYYAVFYWIPAGLVISALASYIVSSIILLPGTISNVMPLASSALALYFMLALVSLIAIYLQWVWEHDADMYATGKTGVAAFTKALVKVYLSSYFVSRAKYVSPVSLSVELKLEDVSPLTWRNVITELLCLTLSLRGLIDFVSIVSKPLEETHPPLYLRLRVIRTVFQRER